MALPVEKFKDKDLILCDSETSKQAHKELFHYKDDDYIIIDPELLLMDESQELDDSSLLDMISAITHVINSCNSPQLHCPSKIHLTLQWENVLRLALWQERRPVTSDLFMLMRHAGVQQDELSPFRSSDVNDIFPWLFYGKRLDVLRKVCQTASKKIEEKFDDFSVRVYCHLIAGDLKKIVASSL